MYGRIHRSVILTNCRLCKTSLAALWAAHANMTILRPFVKSSIGYLWQTSYITEVLRWPLNAWRATPPEYLSSKFLKRAEVSGRSTRISQLLNIPLFKTASGQRTFYYRTVNLWNSLDCSLKLCDSVTVFKNRLRTKLLKESLFFYTFL